MMVRNGEDIHLSMTNHLECNRDSVVPIKTENSSIENLGDDGVASFNKPGHMENRAVLIRSWVTMGYQPMKMIPLPRISEEMRQFYLSRLRYWTVFNNAFCFTISDACHFRRWSFLSFHCKTLTTTGFKSTDSPILVNNTIAMSQQTIHTTSVCSNKLFSCLRFVDRCRWA